MNEYIVYIKPDEMNRIIDVNSSAFLAEDAGWIEIDRGSGDKYHHAQNHYFDKPIVDERWIHRYLYTPDGETLWRERTQEEMEADYKPEDPAPSDSERITALEETMTALIGGIMDAQ